MLEISLWWNVYMYLTEYRLFLDGFDYAQTFAQARLNLTELHKEEHAMTYFLPGPVLANITGLSA